jgi:hypothetical protein
MLPDIASLALFVRVAESSRLSRAAAAAHRSLSSAASRHLALWNGNEAWTCRDCASTAWW